MTNEEAISYLEIAVPVKALTKEEFHRFIEALNMAFKALEQEDILDKIKNDIENYQNFILCANGQKGIHIDEALKIIDKYTGGGKVE